VALADIIEAQSLQDSGAPRRHRRQGPGGAAGIHTILSGRGRTTGRGIIYSVAEMLLACCDDGSSGRWPHLDRLEPAPDPLAHRADIGVT
jgi:hypothetical protein